MNAYPTRRQFLATTTAATFGVACRTRPLWALEAPKGAPNAEKLGWRLGCCAYSFNRFTFYETVEKVASLGLKYVVGFNWQKLDPKRPELVLNDKLSAAEREETKKRLDDAGVKLVCCYCGGWAEEDACRRLFEFAREMGIETLDGEPPPQAYDMLEKLCNEYRINVAVHNHAKPSPYWDPQTLLKLLEGRSKRLGTCCDTGHWGRSGLNPVEALAKLEGRILTFDLKDVNDQGACVPFGKGKSDIRGILKELHRQRFRGVFGIEYDQRAADVEGDIRQCIAFFENVAHELAAT